MKLIRIFAATLFLTFILTISGFSQQEIPQTITPLKADLWLWTFDCKTVFPNPCYPSTGWVKVKMEMLAMDTNARTYNIDVKSEVISSSGHQAIVNFHGNMPPAKEVDITVIPDTSVLPAGVYLIVIKGSCTALGKEEKITKKVFIY